jgi:hypothetical protein
MEKWVERMRQKKDLSGEERKIKREGQGEEKVRYTSAVGRKS